VVLIKSSRLFCGQAMNKAVFLDRDGTINEEMGYINHVSRFKMFSFVPEAIRVFNDAGYKVIVVTNQSGVARGYFKEELVKEIHARLIKEVEMGSAKIDKIYYCPHHPIEGIGAYKKNCSCRKPNTGMIEEAVLEFDLDLSQSYMIGDRYKDTLFANNAGLKSIFVKTGYGLGELTFQQNLWENQPTHIAENLLDAAYFINKPN